MGVSAVDTAVQASGYSAQDMGNMAVSSFVIPSPIILWSGCFMMSILFRYRSFIPVNRNKVSFNHMSG